jgi:ParB-like nuclease family protein
VEIVMVPLDELRPDPDNPRTNSGAVGKVAESIRRFGFNVPIGINADRKILAGHTRFLAASMLGLPEAPCVILDHLNPQEQREYNIADNRASDFSFFDLGKLSEQMDDLSEEFIAEFDIESLMDGLDDQAVPDVPAESTPEKRQGLDLAPFEKYQYVTIICRTTYDYTNLLERLGLEDIQARYVGKYLKRGSTIGRVMEYPDFIARLDS